MEKNYMNDYVKTPAMGGGIFVIRIECFSK